MILEKKYTKAYLEDNREEVLELYAQKHTKSNRPAILTKKQRKILGIGKDRGIAKVSNVRVAPRKVQIVLDQIRDKDVREARAILQYTDKIATEDLIKLLDSAVANAVNNNGMSEDSLYVAMCNVGQGVTLKRYRPRGKGSASPINKRTSNITIVVKARD